MENPSKCVDGLVLLFLVLIVVEMIIYMRERARWLGLSSTPLTSIYTHYTHRGTTLIVWNFLPTDHRQNHLRFKWFLAKLKS
jgi:hypothetical protein